MSIEALKARIPDFAKDVRLNVSSLVNDDTLAGQTKWGLLLAVAIATRNSEVAQAFDAEASAHLEPQARDAARAAASIMAMNNVYYRFVHLASNKEYGTMPAKLRMTVIGNPGVPKTRLRTVVARRVRHQRLRHVHRRARAGSAPAWRGERGDPGGGALCGHRPVRRRRDRGRRPPRRPRSSGLTPQVIGPHAETARASGPFLFARRSFSAARRRAFVCRFDHMPSLPASRAR